MDRFFSGYLTGMVTGIGAGVFAILALHWGLV